MVDSGYIKGRNFVVKEETISRNLKLKSRRNKPFRPIIIDVTTEVPEYFVRTLWNLRRCQ